MGRAPTFLLGWAEPLDEPSHPLWRMLAQQRRCASLGLARARPNLRILPDYSPSDPMGLQPVFEQANLPELRMPFGRELAFGICQEPVDIAALEQPALACLRLVEDVAHQVEERPAQILERR